MKTESTATRQSWCIAVTAIVAVINLTGTAAVLLTGGIDAAPADGAWPGSPLGALLGGMGSFFYAWWWMILPASVMGCMLLWDLSGESEERPPQRPRSKARVAG